VLRDIAHEMRQEPHYAASILDELDVIGVDKFTENAVVIQARIKTVPLKQWEVGRELRRRLLKRFISEGIILPKPKITLSVESAKQAAMLTPSTADAPPPK
jgi:small conductance mechanosensitive channel